MKTIAMRWLDAGKETRKIIESCAKRKANINQVMELVSNSFKRNGIKLADDKISFVKSEYSKQLAK